MRSRRLGNGVGFFPVALLFFDNRLQTFFVWSKKPSSSQLTGSSSSSSKIKGSGEKNTDGQSGSGGFSY